MSNQTQENALQIIEKPENVDKFVKIFQGVHKVDPDTAKQYYEVEKFNFCKELAEKGISTNEVTPFSVAGVFLDVVSNGMSFGSGAKHVYLMPRSVNTKKKDQFGKDIYEKRLVYSTSPDGKIFLCQRSGALDYITKPVMVYEGDDFSIETNEQGNQIIRHKASIPRKSQKIIAGYVYIVHKGGFREPFWMDQSDIDRLAGYSKKQNNGYTNALYSSNNGQIDIGFFGAKLISHALKNIRKMATASVHEVEGEEADAIAAGQQLPEPSPSASYAPSMVVEPVAQPVTADDMDPNAPF